MRFAVRAGNPRPIYTERHRQILRADVVNDLVESALQKGGIDRIIGLYARGGHRRAEHRSVFLADSHVESALGIERKKFVQPEAARHRRRHRRDPLVLAGKLAERVSENFGIFLFLSRADGRNSVRIRRMFLAELVPLSLFGDDVQKDGLRFQKRLRLRQRVGGYFPSRPRASAA